MHCSSDSRTFALTQLNSTRKKNFKWKRQYRTPFAYLNQNVSHSFTIYINYPTITMCRHQLTLTCSVHPVRRHLEILSFPSRAIYSFRSIRIGPISHRCHLGPFWNKCNRWLCDQYFCTERNGNVIRTRSKSKVWQSGQECPATLAGFIVGNKKNWFFGSRMIRSRLKVSAFADEFIFYRERYWEHHSTFQHSKVLMWGLAYFRDFIIIFAFALNSPTQAKALMGFNVFW